MNTSYPFLISIPHGGTEVPEIVRPLLALSDTELRFHCDPDTREIFDFEDRVVAFIDTPVSRMIVDLNRPPLPLPPRDPDGIIKRITIDDRQVYQNGKVPDIRLIHTLLKNHYFPYHQSIDTLLDRHPVALAFDCHSMLPEGSPGQTDAGKPRPLICLGNNGDIMGNPHPGGLSTCPAQWISRLAEVFEDEFSIPGRVAMNDPFSGGFIANAHYWHKGIPWIQIEVNRALYEPASRGNQGMFFSVTLLREKIGNVLERFGKEIG